MLCGSSGSRRKSCWAQFCSGFPEPAPGLGTMLGIGCKTTALAGGAGENIGFGVKHSFTHSFIYLIFIEHRLCSRLWIQL